MSAGSAAPRDERNEHFARVLRVPFLAVALSAALAAVVPGGAGRAAAWVTVGLLVTTPVLRVGWLGVRWWRRGDLRFAGLAGVLLLVVVAGVTVALL